MSWLLRRIESWDQQRLSDLAGRLADSRTLAPFLKLGFRLRYLPRMSEAARPVAGFPTLNDLFARKLRPGARSLSDAALVSPADGRFGASGDIRQGTLIQAKGRTYSIEAFLAGDRALAALLDGGRFATVYLSPRDYHRFHAPCGGRLSRVTYVPGRLLPVNRSAVAKVDQLFAKNERTLFVIETGWGPVVVAAVGAFLVAGVVVTAAPVGAPPDRRDVYTHTFHKPATITRGQELGFFRFGSTVVVLAAPGFPQLVDLTVRSPSRMGVGLTVPGELAPIPELPPSRAADAAPPEPAPVPVARAAAQAAAPVALAAWAPPATAFSGEPSESAPLPPEATRAAEPPPRQQALPLGPPPGAASTPAGQADPHAQAAQGPHEGGGRRRRRRGRHHHDGSPGPPQG